MENGDNRDCINYKIRSHGFRTPLFDQNKGDTFRAVILGDSFTFGEGVKEEDTFPRLLQKNLDIEVINLGMQDLNTTDERVILENYLALSQDLVILGYNINDSMPHRETIATFNELENTYSVSKWLKFSKLFEFLYNRVQTYQHSQKEIKRYTSWFDKGWHGSSQELLTIKKLCEKNNVQFLLAQFPLFADFNDDHPFQFIF